MFGKLTIFDSNGGNPRAYTITQQFTYVGKNKDCDIRFENSVCAGKQFLLTANGNGPVKIQNLSKKYATQVNQKPIGFLVDHDLNEHDVITAGGRKINWSYQTSAAEDLPRIGCLKRTRNSEPARKIAVVTPSRRETVGNEEGCLPLKKRRKTLYESSVHSFSQHQFPALTSPAGLSCFSRRVSYDRMIKGKTTPDRDRSSSRTSGRLTGRLQTPGGSAQKRMLNFGQLESPHLVYSHDAAFNKSITPRTFYSGDKFNGPFTFRGFNPVAEESSSSILGGEGGYSSLNESSSLGRRSGRISTPLHKKRLTSSFQSARTPRNRSVHFPTIYEGTNLESGGRQNVQVEDSFLCPNSGALESYMNDPNHGRDSTPASYFSPTTSGSPRMMRAESPNVQNVGGVSQSSYQGRQSLVSSSRSTPFGTPQGVFLQSQQHDSLFVNNSGSSQLHRRRTQGSFLTDQSHYRSHDSILQSPQSQSFNTPPRLKMPRRSRSVIDSPGSSTYSPMSYNNTEYVLLSPRGRNLVNRSDHSGFSQSPYSPSETTLDFTASPPQRHCIPKTPRRSLSIHVLKKSLQKKANYDFDTSNISSPKRRKSQRKSRAKASLCRSASTPVLTSTDLATDQESSDISYQQSVVEGSDPSMLNFDTGKDSYRRRTPRGSVEGQPLSPRGSRRSQSVPSGSPGQLYSPNTRNTRKSGNRVSLEVSTERKSQRKSRVKDSLSNSTDLATYLESSDMSHQQSVVGGSDPLMLNFDTGKDSYSRRTPRGSVEGQPLSPRGSRRSQSVPSGSPGQLYPPNTRNTRKSGNRVSLEVSTELKSRVKDSLSKSTDLATYQESSDMSHQQSVVGGSDPSMLNFDTGKDSYSRRTPRGSVEGQPLSPRGSRRSQSVPSGSPGQLYPPNTRNTRKSGNRVSLEVSTERKSQRKSRVKDSLSKSTDLATYQESSDMSHQQSVVGGSDLSMLNFDTGKDSYSRRTPRASVEGQPLSPRGSRRSQSVPSGSPGQLYPPNTRNTRKSGNRVSLEVSTSGSPAQANSSRRSKKSGSVGLGDISIPQVVRQAGNSEQMKYSSKSRKSLSQEEMSTSGARRSLESSATLNVVPVNEESMLMRVSRRSLNAQSPKSESTRKLRKSVIDNISESIVPSTPAPSDSLEVKPDSKSSRLSQGKNGSCGRVTRRSIGISSGTPTRPSSGRKSRKSVAETNEETLEDNLSSQVSRRSQGHPSGTPTESRSDRRSQRSVIGDSEGNLQPIAASKANKHDQEEENVTSRVSIRPSSVLGGTPTKSNSVRKSGKSVTVGTEENSDLIEPLPPKTDGEDSLSSRVTRRSQGLDTVSLTPNNEGEDKISRVTRRSHGVSTVSLTPESRKSPREVVKKIPEINIIPPSPSDVPIGSFVLGTTNRSSRRSLRGEISSGRVSQQSLSVRTARKSNLNTTEEPTSTPKRIATSELKLTSSASPELNQSISSSGKRLNSLDTTGRDIKPLVSENGSLKWPVRLPIDTSDAAQFSEDVKPLTSSAMRINKSLPTPNANSPCKRRGSATLDESACEPSTSFINISAIPSLLRTNAAFSTPGVLNIKQSTKVTSTPFPKGLGSRRDGTAEISLESTLPIEIDTSTTNQHSHYTLSDSPHYDTISDEGLFDITDDPGTSARTSLMSKRRRGNRSVSFFAIKSGVKNRKSKPPKNVSIKEEMRSPGKVTPSSASIEVNLRSSRKDSAASEHSPSTPLTAGKIERVGRATRLENRLTKSLPEISLMKIVSPEVNLAGPSLMATSLNTLPSVGARRRLNKSYDSIESDGRKSLRNATTTFKTANGVTDEVTPPRTLSPEVVLRSSRKSASSHSLRLSIPETPTSSFKRNPRRKVKKTSSSGSILKRNLNSIKTPVGSGVKKLKLDPDKPDKKKMAALRVCHVKKSPSKSPTMPEQTQVRRSFERPVTSPTKLNTTVPRNFKFQTSGASTSSLLEDICADTSGKSLTPLKDLDAQPQQLSPEDDLLNALDLSRKSDIVVEPQKPSRRLRSSTQRTTPDVPVPVKTSPSKSSKKLLFRSPLVDFEGCQPHGELHVNTSNIKSILIPSPTRSSDEPMSRVFTTSSVVDYTDSTGKKKIFRASPTSKSGGIRELFPSEEIDLTGVRDLFEHTPAAIELPSDGSSKKRVRKGVVTEYKDVSPPKVAKVSPVPSGSRRKKGALVELDSGAPSLFNESIQSTSPPSPKLPVRKLRSGAIAQSSKPQQGSTSGKTKEATLDSEVNEKDASHEKRKAPSNPKATKAVRVAVASSKAAVRDKAVGSRKRRSLQRISSPKTLRSKEDTSEGFTSNVSPKQMPSRKNSPEKASGPEQFRAVSPKQLRSKNVEASKEKLAVKPAKGSPRKLRSKKVPAAKASPKKSSTKGSPKKASTSKDSPKKGSASQESRKKASPSKDSPKKSSTKGSPKKASALKDSPKKGSASQGSRKKASLSKDSPKKSYTKGSPKKASASKDSPKKGSASQGSRKKASPSKDSPKKTSIRKESPKKVSAAKDSTDKASPKKLRAKKAVASKKTVVNASASKSPHEKVKTSKKAPRASSEEDVGKASTSRKASATGAETKRNTNKSEKSSSSSKRTSPKKTAKPRTQKVSPRKTRSAAKPKKTSPKKAAVSGRKK